MIESLLAAGGGRFLAVVVLQFTARCSQHRLIERHSQLGKTLEYLDRDVSDWGGHEGEMETGLNMIRVSSEHILKFATCPHYACRAQIKTKDYPAVALIWTACILAANNN